MTTPCRGRPARGSCARTLVLLGLLLPALPLEARQGPPPPLPARPLAFPGFAEVVLDNGLRVVLLEYGSQPVVSLRLYAPGGRSADPLEQAGLAALTATVLTKGTQTRTAEAIAETIEGVGGSLTAVAGQDFLNLSAVVLAEHLETAFSLLGDVVLQATFPEAEVELARRQTLSSLQAELGDPQALAARRFAALVHGDTHPYGRAATPTSVEGLTRPDLVAFRDRILRPEGSLLVVAGRIDAVAAEALARRFLGPWSGSASPRPAAQAPPEPAPTAIHLVHRPGSVQSVVAIGHLGIEPGHPDHFALQVLNRVLGGGSDARLFRILREERGWTYGAYSQFTRPALRGHFLAQAEVRTEVTDSTVVEILAQMERLRQEPVPAEELEGARGYLAGSFPLRLETADQVAGQIAASLLLGLPLEEVTEYPERIREVGAQDLLEAARNHLHPDRAVIVVVGDATLLSAPLEAIGPVRYVDVEGNPLDRSEGTAAPPLPALDGTRLEPGLRRYRASLEGAEVGTAEYRLERDGAEWLSTATVSAAGTTRTSRLRFAAAGLAPVAFEEASSADGLAPTRIDVIVEEGRVRGVVALPAALGGARRIDAALPSGVLLAGMDEYALAAVPLREGLRFTLDTFDLLTEAVQSLEVRVAAAARTTVPAGTFETWRVEVSGGTVPMTLHLRRAPPHILVRQEYAGPALRFELTELTDS